MIACVMLGGVFYLFGKNRKHVGIFRMGMYMEQSEELFALRKKQLARSSVGIVRVPCLKENL